MGTLLDIYVKIETLETLLKTVKAKNEKGIAITISVSDETNNYGQNASSFVSQTKEQRDAKKPKFYVGNGKVFWTDGKITAAAKIEKANQDANPPLQSGDSDLPF